MRNPACLYVSLLTYAQCVLLTIQYVPCRGMKLTLELTWVLSMVLLLALNWRYAEISCALTACQSIAQKEDLISEAHY